MTKVNLGKAMKLMSIFRMLENELESIDDIATAGIKEELKKKNPNYQMIMSELKMSIVDGYKGLSEKLTNEIANF